MEIAKSTDENKDKLEIKEVKDENKSKDTPRPFTVNLQKVIPLTLKFYEAPYNKFRRMKVIMLSTVFNQHEKFISMKDRLDIIAEVEESCYKYTVEKANEVGVICSFDDVRFNDIYDAVCAKISANIAQDNDVKNTFLFDAIIEKKIPIDQVAKMSSQELFPGRDQAIIERIEKSRNVVKTVRVSHMFTCKFCKKNNCEVENVQLRSADEGYNLSVKCQNCGKTMIL